MQHSDREQLCPPIGKLLNLLGILLILMGILLIRIRYFPQFFRRLKALETLRDSKRLVETLDLRKSLQQRSVENGWTKAEKKC